MLRDWYEHILWQVPPELQYHGPAMHRRRACAAPARTGTAKALAEQHHAAKVDDARAYCTSQFSALQCAALLRQLLVLRFVCCMYYTCHMQGTNTIRAVILFACRVLCYLTFRVDQLPLSTTILSSMSLSTTTHTHGVRVDSVCSGCFVAACHSAHAACGCQHCRRTTCSSKFAALIARPLSL